LNPSFKGKYCQYRIIWQSNFRVVQNLTAFWDGGLGTIANGQQSRSLFLGFELSQPMWDSYI